MKYTLLAAIMLMVAPFAKADFSLTKTDGKFGMSVEGLYGFSSDRDTHPDMGGGLLGVYWNIQSGSFYSQVSLTSGILHGSDSSSYYGESTEVRATTVPLLIGYTANFPVSNVVVFYLGAKAGAAFGDYEVDSWSENKTSFMYAIEAGIKVSLSNTTDLKFGYLQTRTQVYGHSNPLHCITLGIEFTF